jgi:hypothetical protein
VFVLFTVTIGKSTALHLSLASHRAVKISACGKNLLFQVALHRIRTSCCGPTLNGFYDSGFAVPFLFFDGGRLHCRRREIKLSLDHGLHEGYAYERRHQMRHMAFLLVAVATGAGVVAPRTGHADDQVPRSS